MWKIAVFAFCLCVGLSSAGRLPRSAESAGDEECFEESQAENQKYVKVDGDCYKMATESQNQCTVQEQCADISSSLCIDGECLGQKGLGEPCESNGECEKELVCTAGTCECSLGYVQFGDGCLMQAGALGDDCEQTVQCEGVTGVCVNGTCQASGPSVVLCNDENAERCNDGLQCREGFVESDDGKSCLKEAEKIGDDCSTAKQCESVNGTCAGGICTEVKLSAAAIPIEVTPILGSDCETDEHCKSVSNAVCKESICQCAETHVPSEDASKCLPLAKKAGDACEIDKQCSKLSGSSCLGGKCAAVAAAGMKIRKNGTSSPFATTAQTVISTIIVLGSRAIFA